MPKSHLFHTSKVCTISPEAGLWKAYFWNTSFLKPQLCLPNSFPMPGSQLRQVFLWILKKAAKGFILKHRTKNWSMIHLAASILLPTTSSRTTGEGTSPAYVQTPQYPLRTCLQCADPTTLEAVDADWSPSFMRFTNSAYIYILFNNKGSFPSFDRDTPTNT